MRRSRLYGGLGLLLIVLLFGAVNLAAGGLLARARIDLTEDRLYTLNPGTRALLGGLDQTLTLRLYFSDRAASGLAPVKAYGQRVTELLKAFERAGNGRIRLRLIDPEPFTDAEDEAQAFGLTPAQVDGRDSVYFGLVATDPGSGRETIPFFDENREPQLEYDIARLIDRLAHPKRPKVAVLTTLPLAFGAGGPMAMAQGQSHPNLIYGQMRDLFDVTLIDRANPMIPADTQVLVLMHPPALSAAQQFALDQYVMKGGALVAFLDPFAELSQPAQGPFQQTPAGAPPPSSTLMPMLAAWGLELPPDSVVADARLAQAVGMPQPDGQTRITYFPTWVGATAEFMDAGAAITSRLSQVNFASPGVLGLLPRPGVKAIPLITSSEDAERIAVAKVRFDPDPDALLRDLAPTRTRYALAVQLTGALPSAFATGGPSGEKAVTRARNGRIIVVADTDLLDDNLWAQVQAGPGGLTVRPLADNGAFVVNAIDSLLGSPELISIRSRGQTARPFLVIDEMKRRAAKRYRAREALLQNEVAATEDRIRALENKGGGQGKFLTDAQNRELNRFRDKVLEARLALRGVQRTLRNEVEALQDLLAGLNIALVPLILLAIALIRQWRRSRRARPA